MFLALDKDMNGTLSKQELKEYAEGTLTEIFIERGKAVREVLYLLEMFYSLQFLLYLINVYNNNLECACLFSAFDEHVRRGKGGAGNSREMDFESFLDFVLALENKDAPEGLAYLFRCLDLHGRGYLTTADIHTLFR